MATIRKLRGRWQAQVRRRGMKARARSFDTKADAERWARQLEAEVDRAGIAPDTRKAESTTLKDVLLRCRGSVSPAKRSAVSEIARINALVTREIASRTLAMLSSSEVARYRDARLKEVAPRQSSGSSI